MTAPPLVLSGELTIYHVAQHFQTVRDHVTTQRNALFDLSGVEELDSAGVQLLLIAKAQAETQGLPFAVVAYSPVVEEVLQVLFLKRTLGLAETALTLEERP